MKVSPTETIRVRRDMNADDLSALTLASLATGAKVVWLAGTRRLGVTFEAAKQVEQQHPGVVGTRDHRSGRSRTFWWPANTDPATPIGFWPGD